MRLNFVRRAEDDIEPTPIRFPSGNTVCSKMLVREGDAPVVLVPKFVFDRVGRGIPPKPEFIDELISFFVIGESSENAALLIGNDPADIFFQPRLIY